MRRQPVVPAALNCHLREVVGAEAGDRGQLLQARAGDEVFLDVLDDGEEPPPRQRAVPPAAPGRRAAAATCRIRWTAKILAQGLGGERAPDAAGRQFGVHRQHRGPELRDVMSVERWDRQPRRVEVERLGGHPGDQPRLQVDVERVLEPTPAPQGRGAGRHHGDRSGGGR